MEASHGARPTGSPDPMTVCLHFFGEPQAERDGKRIAIPLKKAEALLFYAALEGRVPRDRAKLLFWGDKDEALAANSLRNSLHVLRRALPDNCEVDRRSLLVKGIVKDLDRIPKLEDPSVPIGPTFLDEPLQGFDALGGPEFDAWLGLTRNMLRGRVAESLRTRAAACYERGRFDGRTEALSALLMLDPFDEDSVLELMESWHERGYTAKAVSLYENFRTRMQSEIGIGPSSRAEAFLRRIAGGTAASQPIGERFCCREAEVERIVSFLSDGRRELKLVLVHGEAGIGKTSLVNRALALNAARGTDILAARPELLGPPAPYSAWNGLIAHMGKRLEERGIPVAPSDRSALSGTFYGFSRRDVSPGTGGPPSPTPFGLGRIVSRLLDSLASNTRLILVLEDLHEFDLQSLLLLEAVLTKMESALTVLLTTRPEGAAAIGEMLDRLKPSLPHRSLRIPLGPLDPAETLKFCRSFLPDDLVSLKGAEYFVRGSEGIPLLLAEMLRSLSEDPDGDPSAGLAKTIMARMKDLSPTQRRLLEALSAFRGSGSLEDVALFLNLSPGELVEPMEGLLRKKLIHETADGDRLLADFCHANVRDCVYESLPGFKRREFHRRIAEILSARYSPRVWNPTLSAALRHHYRMAGLRTDELKLHLSEMSFHIALNHTLFPLIEDRVLHSCSIPFGGREETEFKIAQVRELLGETEGTESVERTRMEASFLELWGGYRINWGDYRPGRALIERALALSRQHGFDEIRLHCLEHMGHRFLQTDESARLKDTGRAIVHLAKRLGKEHHMGLGLRFLGVHRMIERDFEGAERILAHSAALFEDLSLLGRNYTLNLLAPRCYIGETRQWRGDPDGAMEHFCACIERCSDAGFFWGLSHFHAHAADAALDMGCWNLARDHIEEGVTLFESCRGGHCGSLLYSLKAILDARDNRPDDVRTSLEKGDRLSAIGKRSWCAAQLMAKAWAASMAERGELDGERLGPLPGTPQSYAGESAALYSAIGAERRARFVRRTFGVE